MKHGLIRIAAVTPSGRVADLSYNCDAAIAAARKAAEDGARVLTLPALTLTGACLGDLYFSEALIAAAALLTLIEAFEPFMGSETRPSTILSASGCTPKASFPKITARGNL